MRKVKTFEQDWFHKIDSDINDWAKKKKVRIISASVFQGNSGGFLALVTYEENPEEVLFS